MSLEWINIIDTSVKIGLGALISGSFSVLAIKRNHKNTIDHYLLEHKFKLLEMVTEESEYYLQTLANYFGTLSGHYINREDTEQFRIEASMNPYLLNESQKVVDSWNNKQKAMSYLSLLGITEASEKLDQTSTIEFKIRDRLLFKNDKPSMAEIEEARIELKMLKEEYFLIIANFYKSI